MEELVPRKSYVRDLLERALWTGVESGLAILTADSFGWINSAPHETLIVAGLATFFTAIKVISGQRLNDLGH